MSTEDEAREKRKQAAQLRLAGVDWQTIADRVGYASRGAAYTAVEQARQRSQRELDETVDELRQLDLDRIGRLLAAVWPKALKGDEKAVESAHKLIMSDAKLRGLEPPTKIMLMARIEVEAANVVEAIMAAITVLDLPPDKRMLALETAQGKLHELAELGIPEEA